eukprot:4262136-Karenia_brevis.AAC.1
MRQHTVRAKCLAYEDAVDDDDGDDDYSHTSPHHGQNCQVLRQVPLAPTRHQGHCHQCHRQ